MNSITKNNISVIVHGQKAVNTVTSNTSMVKAMLEIFKNAYDSDATEIKIKPILNHLNVLESLEISDNGIPLSFTEIEKGFSHYFESVRKNQTKTLIHKRSMQDHKGIGRLTLGKIGNSVSYSFYKDGQGIRFFIDFENSTNIEMETLESTTFPDGCAIKIEGLNKSLRADTEGLSFKKKVLIPAFLEYYAILHCNHIRVYWNDSILDLKDYVLKNEVDQKEINQITVNYEIFYTIDYIENLTKNIFFMNEDGRFLGRKPYGLRNTKLNTHTFVTLPNDIFKDLVIDLEEGDLSSEEFKNLLRDIKQDIILKFDRENRALFLEQTIDKIKKHELYPKEFLKPRLTSDEQLSKALYEMAITEIFEITGDKIKWNAGYKNQIKLVALTIAKTGNELALESILQEFFSVSSETSEIITKYHELHKICAFASEMMNKKAVISHLEHIHTNLMSKKTLTEVKHLHPLLAKNAWVFGDEYILYGNEQTLNNTIKNLCNKEPNTFNEDDSKDRRRLDLGLAAFGDPNRNFLIVELKRPSKTIGFQEYQQIYSYYEKLKEHYIGNQLDAILIGGKLGSEVHSIRKTDVPIIDRNYGRVSNSLIKILEWKELIELLHLKMKAFDDSFNTKVQDYEAIKIFLKTQYPELNF